MTYDKHECDLMCERLAAYMEGDLSPAEQAAAEEHLADCAPCAEVLAELRAIASQAATMPLLEPSRDLWSGVESRIATPVTQFGGSPTAVKRGPRHPWRYAIAAAALIAASAGTTYLVVARHGGSTTPVVTVANQAPVLHNDSASTPAPGTTATPRVTPAPAPSPNTRLVSGKKDMSAARVYDLEISLLDSMVRTRRESLDPKTVAIIEQNLKIIDKAIIESRAALAKDPRSPLLSNQLDNVLGSKVELLRTVAFLPTQS